MMLAAQQVQVVYAQGLQVGWALRTLLSWQPEAGVSFVGRTAFGLTATG